jgi:hypothetical protein
MPPSQTSHSFAVDGVPAVASISPCSWMYSGHVLQVEVRVAGGRTYFQGSMSYDSATDADVVALAEQVRLCPCTRCKSPAIDDPKSNRAGLCEKCFMGDLDARYQKARQKEEGKEAAQNAKAKKQGYLFKTVAVVHPKNGGDDYRVFWYSATAPTAAEVADILRKRRSAVLDDYATAAL